MNVGSPNGKSRDIFGAEFNGSPCHHRVLKPPGGGSHDIFGKPDEPVTPRRLSAQSSSSINLNEDIIQNGNTPPLSPDQHASLSRRGSCNERIFGPSSDGQTNGVLTNGHTPNGHGHTNGYVKEESVTDGHIMTNGKAETPIKNGNLVTPPSTPSPAKTPGGRNRVPPGGYSSGLWVLKPPGGGPSNIIFGGDTEKKTSSDKKNQNTGKSNTCTTNADNASKNITGKEHGSAPQATESKTAAPVQRVRMPPGGQSSSFW